MKKYVVFTLLCLTLSGCTSQQDILAQEQSNREQKAFDLQMKQECSNKQYEWENYFFSSDLYEEINGELHSPIFQDGKFTYKDVDCSTNIFYSDTKNSCIGTYTCGNNKFKETIRGAVDYLTKEKLMTCGGSYYSKSFKELSLNQAVTEKIYESKIKDGETIIVLYKNSLFPNYDVTNGIGKFDKIDDKGIFRFNQDFSDINDVPDICQMYFNVLMDHL